MAGKPQNRKELRRQYEAAEPLDPMEEDAEDAADEGDDEDAAERRPKKKPKAPAKSKAKAVKAVKPTARSKIVWVVMSDAFKPIATFEFSQKEAAETKAKEMTERGKGTHFVHKSKEPMQDDAPGVGAAIPRPVLAPFAPAAKTIAAVVAIEDDDEADDDEETETEPDFDDEDDEE